MIWPLKSRAVQEDIYTITNSIIISKHIRIIFNENEEELLYIYVMTTDMLWNTNVIYQNSWQFIIKTDETFGIDTKYDSTITFTVNMPQANTEELFFAFTTDNTKYISMSIPINNPNKLSTIYPACTLISHTNIFGVGDIAGIPQTNRACDIAGGSCNNWKYMLPPNIGMAVETPWPLTFKIKNDIILNELIFSFHSSTFVPNFIQTCRFSQDFISRKGLKIYVAGDKFPDAFSVYSFNITSSTLSPTYTPTPAPTLSPTTTYKPTKYPTTSPTFTPTTPYPTLLTHSPSKNPVPAPSPYPTNFPTYEPTISPTLPTFKPSINPTLFPTIFTQTPTLQTKKPTPSPSPYPTEIPTSEPTDFPTNIPTVHPSVAPLTVHVSQFGNNVKPTKTNRIISFSPTDARNGKTHTNHISEFGTIRPTVAPQTHYSIYGHNIDDSLPKNQEGNFMSEHFKAWVLGAFTTLIIVGVSCCVVIGVIVFYMKRFKDPHEQEEALNAIIDSNAD